MRTTFKLADKTKALELLGKYQKLFTEKIQHVFPEQPVDLSRLTNEELAIVERILESADITDEGVDEGSEGKG